MKTMSIPDFVRMGWQKESGIDALFAHLKHHKIKYRIIGTAIILLFGCPDASYASAGGIDPQANQLYKKLLNIGKWVIIFKGGLDTIKSITEGDAHATKKNFLGYLLTYIILSGLPWSMNEIDKMFRDMGDGQ